MKDCLMAIVVTAVFTVIIAYGGAISLLCAVMFICASAVASFKQNALLIAFKLDHGHYPKTDEDFNQFDLKSFSTLEKRIVLFFLLLLLCVPSIFVEHYYKVDLSVCSSLFSEKECSSHPSEK